MNLSLYLKRSLQLKKAELFHVTDAEDEISSIKSAKPFYKPRLHRHPIKNTGRKTMQLGEKITQTLTSFMHEK